MLLLTSGTGLIGSQVVASSAAQGALGLSSGPVAIDPLGPLIKILPVLVLHLVAPAIREEP